MQQKSLQDCARSDPWSKAELNIKFNVLLTAGAEQDSEAIYDYTSQHYLVTDGRRDMQSLLTRRLLGAYSGDEPIGD